jgi:hypothetical protein
MHWALISAVALGLILGLRFKVHAIAIGSAAILVGGTLVGAASAWPLGWAFLLSFATMIAFQCGYFLGVGLMCVARRQQPLKGVHAKNESLDNALADGSVRTGRPLSPTA